MSIKAVLAFGALILRDDVAALALPQVPPIVVTTGLGGGFGAGTQTTIGGGIGIPTIPPKPTGIATTTGAPLGPGGAGVATGAQVGVPVPVVSVSTSTVSVSPASGTLTSFSTIKVSSASIPAVTAGPLLPPIPISPGPLSPVVNPIVQGTLNIPGVQNTDLSGLTTLVSVNVPALLPTGGSLPTGVSLPTGGLPISSGTGGMGLTIPSIPISSSIFQALSSVILALFEAIFQQQAAGLLSTATGSIASVPGISAPSLPATLPAVATALSGPSVPSVPQLAAGAVTSVIPGGPNLPAGGIPASSLLSVTNVSALTASFPTLGPRAPQLGPIVGSLPTSVKVLTSIGTLVPVPASLPVGAAPALPTGAISPAGLGGSLPTPGIPTIPAGVPSIPNGIAPSLPAGGIPSLPAPSLPALSLPAPSLPAPSLPGPSLPGPSLPAPSLPGLSLPAPSLPGPSLPAPSLPAGVAPSLPAGVAPTLPTGLAGGVSVPTATVLPNIPTTITGLVPSANLSGPIPTLPSASLPGTSAVPAIGTPVPPNLPPSVPTLPVPLPTSSLIPEGYGGLPPLPTQPANVDTLIGAATEKLGESDELSQQLDTLTAILSVLAIENPAAYGSLVSLDSLGSIEDAASSLNPTDLDTVQNLLATLQVSPAEFLFNAVNFVKTITKLQTQVGDFKGTVAYTLLSALALS